MYTVQIFIPRIEDVKAFVNIANKYPYSINIVTDVYKIDAKSIMGIFSLDLSAPLSLEIETQCPTEFLEEIDQFIVKES